eukprot:CAMPEP_0198702460 /NCGR_PEP_ID=MMETSP1468-20131203/388777_1 /TAXON_ID=1461545 /ORGANISM="Mantoniella sp, Strain CCMP1436" /LENGTH=407 /DNA_ID=CAMNT_0044460999 /DNA_START=80 /DNA_END=1300 /DNA_ORIENTATION=-
MQHIFFYDQSSGTSALMLADANLDAWNPASLTTSLPPSPLSFDSVTGYAPRGPLTMDGLPGQFLGLSEDARLVVLHVPKGPLTMDGLPGLFLGLSEDARLVVLHTALAGGNYVTGPVRANLGVGGMVSDPGQGQATMNEAYWAFLYADAPYTKVVRLKVTIRSVEVLRPDPPELARSYSSVAFGQAPGTGHARSMLDGWTWAANEKVTDDPLNYPHWMKIDLGLSQMVAGVIVRGRGSTHQWQYVNRVILFVIHENGMETNMGTYDTNLNGDERMYREIVFTNGPIMARSVRIQTDGCNSHCSMRAGVLVPSAGKAYIHATNAFYQQVITTSIVGIDIAEFFANRQGSMAVVTAGFPNPNRTPDGNGYGVLGVSYTISPPPHRPKFADRAALKLAVDNCLAKVPSGF